MNWTYKPLDLGDRLYSQLAVLSQSFITEAIKEYNRCITKLASAGITIKTAATPQDLDKQIQQLQSRKRPGRWVARPEFPEKPAYGGDPNKEEYDLLPTGDESKGESRFDWEAQSEMLNTIALKATYLSNIIRKFYDIYKELKRAKSAYEKAKTQRPANNKGYQSAGKAVKLREHYVKQYEAQAKKAHKDVVDLLTEAEEMFSNGGEPNNPRIGLLAKKLLEANGYMNPYSWALEVTLEVKKKVAEFSAMHVNNNDFDPNKPAPSPVPDSPSAPHAQGTLFDDVPPLPSKKRRPQTPLAPAMALSAGRFYKSSTTNWGWRL